MSEWWPWIIQQLITAGLGGAAAVWLARTYFDKWLASRFSEKAEWLRMEINTNLDRKIKLHEKEFDTVAVAWTLLVEAKGGLEYYLSALREMADISRMSDMELDEFLAGSGFFLFQIEELKQLDANSRIRMYSSLLTLHEAERCKKAIVVFTAHVDARGIFMPDETYQKLTAVGNLMWDAFIEKRVQQDEPVVGRPDRTKAKRFKEESPQLVEDIQRVIRERFWS